MKMHLELAVPAPVLGVTFAVLAGIMCGAFALPMKYLDRWSWENVWTVFILVSCVLMPVVIARATVSNFLRVFTVTPLHAIASACGFGFAWGFGAIMFGQGVSAIGLSMANTLVLAISASLGSFLPVLLLAPERLHEAQGTVIIVGTLIGIAGIACCGYAGFLRERSQASSTDSLRGKMVGYARPFGIGLLLCAGAGLLSAVLNIGYSLAQPVAAIAIQSGYSAFAGSNLIWLLMLTCGAIPNLCYCGFLFKRNHSWNKFAAPHSAQLYLLTIAMGLMWGGDIFVYGLASPTIGKLGPAIGWPVKLIAGLITANVAGIVTGEWRLTRSKDRRWMTLGLVVLCGSIAVLAWSSTMQ